MICKERHRADPEGSIQKRKTVSNLQKERLTKDVRYQEFREIALGKRSGQAMLPRAISFFVFIRLRAVFSLQKQMVVLQNSKPLRMVKPLPYEWAARQIKI